MRALSSLAATTLLGITTAHQVQQPLQGTLRKPLVDSEELQSKIDGDNLFTRAKDLYKFAELSWHEYNRPTRVIGSAGHAATLDYIYATLAKLGDYYNVSGQQFPAFTGNVYESRLVLGSDVLQNASAMSLTPGTKGNEPVSFRKPCHRTLVQ